MQTNTFMHNDKFMIACYKFMIQIIIANLTIITLWLQIAKTQILIEFWIYRRSNTRFMVARITLLSENVVQKWLWRYFRTIKICFH